MTNQSIMHEPPSSSVFNSFRAHNTSSRTSTELTILESIRQAYPGHQVTLTSPGHVDLRGYAAAGLAKLTLDNTNEHDVTRLYKAPVNRLSKLVGTLKDQIRFVSYAYDFANHHFIVYQAEYESGQMFKKPIKLLYVVSLEDDDKSIVDNLLLTVGQWSSNLHSEIYVYDSGIWAKDKSLYTSVQNADFSSVILSPSLKKTLTTDVTTFFLSRQTYARLSVPWKRGLLFHGYPGNGKTVSICAIISMLAALDDPVPSLVVKNLDCSQGPKFSISQVFSKARSMAPCLLIFEDLDSLITDKTRSYFLNEVDGLECNDGILMIGTTNHLDSLDPAISKRPSRFDRKFHFKLPGLEERVLYAEFWREKLSGGADANLEFGEEMSSIIAKLTDGFSFAYMKELFVISLLTIARGEEDSKADTAVEKAANVHEQGDKDTALSEPLPLAISVCACQSKDSTVDTTASEKPKPAKKKRSVPEVVVPEHLKNNLLLRVLKGQCQLLLDEMDNTDEEEWVGSSSKGRNGGSEGINPYLAALNLDEDECC